MKTKLLAALATATIALAAGSREATPTEFESRASFSVSVQAEDSSTVASGLTEDTRAVRDCIAAVYGKGTAPEEGLQIVRAALEEQYPSLVSEMEHASYYTWEWNEERGEWEFVCCSPTTFRIALPHPVIVETGLQTPLERD